MLGLKAIACAAGERVRQLALLASSAIDLAFAAFAFDSVGDAFDAFDYDSF